MHLYICYHQSRRILDCLYFYLSFSVADLLRVVGEAASHLICILLWSELLASDHRWVFGFLGCAVQHLDLSGKSWGLLSVLEGSTWFFYLWRFWRGSKVLWGTLSRFLRKMAWRFRPDISGGLCSCRRVFNYSNQAVLVVFLCDYSCPLLSFIKGDPFVFGVAASLCQGVSWGFFSLPSGLDIPRQWRYHGAVFRSLQRRFFAVFLLIFFEEGRFKNRGNWKFCWYCSLGFYFRLT